MSQSPVNMKHHENTVRNTRSIMIVYFLEIYWYGMDYSVDHWMVLESFD